MDPKKAEESRDRSQRDINDTTGREVAPAQQQDAHGGVEKVEAALRISGRYARWCLFICLALAAYIFSLDDSTTYAYIPFATSSFGEHSLLSSVVVVQSLIMAVGKPIIAKVADVSSRGTAYVGVLFFYVLGYIVIASASNVATMAGGIALYAMGFTGFQVLTQILIADITTLQWRGLVVGLVSLPFLANTFVGPNISTAVIEHVGWRWGYGMFAILVPALLSPLTIMLLWAEYKARKFGFVGNLPDDYRDIAPSTADTLLRRLWRTAAQLDLVGLVLLCAAVSLVLLPLTLSQIVEDGWKNGSIIAMLTVGVVLLFVFAFWDLRVASHPVVPPRFLKNRSVVFASLIGFFDFASFYLTYTYLYSFILVVETWSLVDATYFILTQAVTLTFFGALSGVALRLTRRYKYILVGSLVVRLAGVAMMLYARGAHGSAVALVWTQILQGLGGGPAGITSQVGAQAAVPHADVATVTAVVLLVTEVGAAVGTACAGAIWASTMPHNLAKYLPGLTDAQRAALYGSITSVRAHPRGDPVREGVIRAYGDTMAVMIWCAIGTSIVPILCAIGMPNWYLGDKQNAVDSMDLAGRVSTGQEDDAADGTGGVVGASQA